MNSNLCLVCHTPQENSCLSCSICSGLTEYGAYILPAYKPERLLTRWEGGCLYLGKLKLDTTNNHTSQTTEEESYVWIFIYEEEFASTPHFGQIQREDRLLSQLPHPLLPSQLDHGMIGQRPYTVFEGKELATPLPSWRPHLPPHVISTIFSRLSELVIILQSADLQRPVLDPYRIMVFWDEALDMLNFQWLPLPDLGDYLYREGFIPQKPPRVFQTPTPPMMTSTSLKAPNSKRSAFANKRSKVVTRGPLQEEEQAPAIQKVDEPDSFSSDEITAVLPAPNIKEKDSPKQQKQRDPLSRTDEFELSSLLRNIGEPSNELEDIASLAKRLAELEKATRVDETEQDETTNSQKKVNPDKKRLGEEGIVTHFPPALASDSPIDMLASVYSTGEPNPSDGNQIICLTQVEEEGDPLLEEESFDFGQKSSVISEEFNFLQVASVPTKLKTAEYGEYGKMAASQTTTSDHQKDPNATTSPDPEEQHFTSVPEEQHFTPLPFTAPERLTNGQFRELVPLSPKSQIEEEKELLLLRSSTKRSQSIESGSQAELARTSTDIAIFQAEQFKFELQTTHKMLTNQIFPLHITIHEQAPKKTHAHSDQFMVEPLVPGCIVSPLKQKLILDGSQQTITFWLAPIAPGKLQHSASLRFSRPHQTDFYLPLSIEANTLTPVKNAMLAAIMSVFATFVFQMNHPTNLSVETQQMIGWGGYIMALLFLLLAGGIYWSRRPQETRVHVEKIGSFESA